MTDVKKPELFKLIELADECLLSLKRLHVIHFEKYKEVKQKRVLYSSAAAAYIKRQRGS